MSDIFKKLSEPFPADSVSWRVGNTNKKKVVRETGDPNARPTKGVALAYIDARDVMDRLDEAVGPANWSDIYETHGTRTICRLSLRIDGEWITKSDGAGDTDVEAEKGSISDALKRAAVKWGIGRYLYDVPSLWVDLDQCGQIDRKEYDRLHKILPAKIEGAKESPAHQETPFDGEPAILPASIEPNEDFQKRIADTLIAALEKAENSVELAEWVEGADTKRTIADLPKDQADRVRVAYTAHRAALTKKAA